MDCLQFLRLLPDNYVSSIVTDPPYELGFMNKRWDSTGITYNIDLWKESLRVLKPGGHLLAFSGTRTYHRMASAIEDAGYEIRDMIEWLYFSGFAKGLDISKAIDKKFGMEREIIGINPNSKGRKKNTGKFGGQEGEELADISRDSALTIPSHELAKEWQGWGSNLKPSHEPILLARKPLSEKTIVDNVLKWGVGGLNIDECRIHIEEKIKTRTANRKSPKFQGNTYGEWDEGAKEEKEVTTTANPEGRFPANSITLEENEFFSKYFNITPPELCKKASKKDRNSDWEGNEIDLTNKHPTIKPLFLMDFLIRLITPPEGLVLDFFAGSGSSLVSAKRLGVNFLGTELEKEYYEIAKKRLGL